MVKHYWGLKQYNNLSFMIPLKDSIYSKAQLYLTNRAEKWTETAYHQYESSSYFLTTKNPLRHFLPCPPALGSSVQLGCSEKNFPLLTPFCDERKLPRKLLPDGTKSEECLSQVWCYNYFWQYFSWMTL